MVGIEEKWNYQTLDQGIGVTGEDHQPWLQAPLSYL